MADKTFAQPRMMGLMIDVLRKGVKHGPQDIELFYGTPSPGNAKSYNFV